MEKNTKLQVRIKVLKPKDNDVFLAVNLLFRPSGN